MANTISLSMQKSARSLLYMVIGSVAVFLLFVVAPISYILAYKYYIPYNSVRVPLQFDFSVVRTGAYDTLRLYNSPDATFVVPENLDYELKLKKSIDYTLSIELDIPRDNYNKEMGNFMVRTTWMDDIRPLFNRRKANRTVSHRWPLTSSFRYPDCISDRRVMRRTKPVILPYQSNLMNVFNTVFLYPCYVTGFCKEHSSVRVEMMNWSHRSVRPLPEFLVVEIDREVHINSAAAEWTVQWRGVRYFMHHYKVTAFLVGSIFFWLVETLCMGVVSILIVRMFGEPYDSDAQTQRDGTTTGSGGSKPKEENIFAQRRRHLRALIRETQPTAADKRQPLSTSEGSSTIDIHDPAGLLGNETADQSVDQPSLSSQPVETTTEKVTEEVKGEVAEKATDPPSTSGPEPSIGEPEPSTSEPEPELKSSKQDSEFSDIDSKTLKSSIPSSPVYILAQDDNAESTPTIDTPRMSQLSSATTGVSDDATNEPSAAPTLPTTPLEEDDDGDDHDKHH
ncbi:hypothetical protein TRVA0_009S02102 [Trichomonascus vanleenenianus]|uniref:uncharacterized protein n=1 Tax=Trichomonascus vanleenenianus TaxID=2268995 RepID=UPI003ECB8D81